MRESGRNPESRKIKAMGEIRMTELSMLPGDWKTVALGELFDFRQGKALSQRARKGSSPHSFLRTSNVYWGKVVLANLDRMDFSPEEQKHYALRYGDLLVCEGGDIGRTAIWREEVTDCYHQNHLHRLRPKDNRVVSEFYMYWMTAAIKLFGLYVKEGNRTTIPNLSMSRLMRFEVPFPPFREQKRIAAVLSSVQEADDKTEAVINAEREIRKSLMVHLFTYGPVSMANAESVRLKNSELGTIPSHWRIVELGSVCTKVQDGSHFSPKTQYQEGGKGRFLYITSKNIKEHGIDLSTASYVDSNYHESIFPRCNPEKDDVLLIKDGAMTGVATNNNIDQPFSLLSSVVLIKPDRKVLDPFYLRHFLNSQKGLKEITGQMTGSAIRRIILDRVRKASIPLPSIEEQRSIRDILNTAENSLVQNEFAKDGFKQLFNALLRSLMTGRLRVNNLEVPS